MKHILAAFVLCALSSASIADSYAPSHYCSKPSKPFQFDSQWEIDNWKDEVDTYQRCIKAFVEDQNEEADNHREAARDAIAEWNRFVRFELN